MWHMYGLLWENSLYSKCKYKILPFSRAVLDYHKLNIHTAGKSIPQHLWVELYFITKIYY